MSWSNTSRQQANKKCVDCKTIDRFVDRARLHKAVTCICVESKQCGQLLKYRLVSYYRLTSTSLSSTAIDLCRL
jgi:hypothetical protein